MRFDNYITIALFGIMTAVFMASCARQEPRPTKPITPAAQLWVFSAPWCHSCKTQLPGLDALMKDKKRVMHVFVTTGAGPKTQANDSDTAAYANFMKLNVATFHTDLRWKRYNDTVPEMQRSLPAAAFIEPGACDANTGVCEAKEILATFGPGEIERDIQKYVN